MHPRALSPSMGENAVEEEIEVYEDDWDDDNEPNESQKAPTKENESKEKEPLSKCAETLVDTSVGKESSIPAQLSNQAASSEITRLGPESKDSLAKKTVFRELDFSEALKVIDYCSLSSLFLSLGLLCRINLTRQTRRLKKRLV